MRWNGRPIALTILGQPVSMKNDYVIAFSRKQNRYFLAPGKKVKGYARDFSKQALCLSPLIECEVSVTMRLFYASRRSDLNEDQILDLLQKRVYRNDRQVWEKHVYKAIDKANPRAEIIVAPILGELFGSVAVGETLVTERRCLRCDEDFLSEGPHNRICKVCKDSNAWRSGGSMEGLDV